MDSDDIPMDLPATVDASITFDVDAWHHSALQPRARTMSHL